MPNDSRLCTPLTRHGNTYSHVLNGSVALHNPDDTPFTIRKVTMAHPQGFKVTGARVTPVLKDSRGYTTLIGVVPGPRDEWSRHVMAHARPAIGASVAPHSTVFLIVDLVFQPGQGGSSGPERVLYTDSQGTEHLWTGGTHYDFTTKEDCPRYR